MDAKLGFGPRRNFDARHGPRVHSSDADFPPILNAGDLREVRKHVERLREQLIAVANQEHPYAKQRQAASDEYPDNQPSCAFHF
jgi:hypothetical protein